MVHPKDPKAATLGKTLDNLRDTRGERPDWVNLIEPLMRNIWENHHDRHGTLDLTNVTRTEALNAFYTAVLVIQTLPEQLAQPE